MLVINDNKLNGDIMFDKFFEINLGLLCIASMDGVFLKLNKSWEDTLGYRLEELEGRKFIELVHPDDIDATLKTMASLKEQLQVMNFTNRYKCKDGSYKYIEWRSQPYGNYIYASARDITEHKQDLEKLRESETNFKTFFDAIDDIMIVGNSAGEIVYANDATSNKLGYSNQELLKMQVLELNPSNKRAEAEAIFAEMFAGKRNSCPLPLEKNDGTYLPAETRVWFGSWNGVDSIFGISKDLSIQVAALNKFQMLFDSNPSLMAINNISDNKFTDVNAAFLEKLGYQREEILGKTAVSLGLFEEIDKQKKVSQTILKDGSVKNIELRVKKKDGQILDGLFSGVIIDNQLEKSCLTVMVDITERRKAEKEKEKQAGLILSLFDSIPDIIFAKDKNGVYLGVNPSYAKFAGKLQDYIVGKTSYDIFDKDIADVFTYVEKEAFKQRIPKQYEQLATSFDGSTVLFDMLLTPYWDAKGNLVGILGIGRDITDRKQKKEEIAKKDGLFISLFNAIPDIVFCKDPEGFYLSSNPSHAMFLGKSVDEVIGKTDYDFFDKETVEEFRHSDKEVLRKRVPQRFDQCVTAIDGTKVLLDIIKTPYFDTAGNLIGVLGIGRDITQRKAK
jgi:PAS domain S-box-containing protein